MKNVIGQEYLFYAMFFYCSQLVATLGHRHRKVIWKK